MKTKCDTFYVLVSSTTGRCKMISVGEIFFERIHYLH